MSSDLGRIERLQRRAVREHLTKSRAVASFGAWVGCGTAARLASFSSADALRKSLERGRTPFVVRRRTSGMEVSTASICSYLEQLARAAEGGPM